MEPLYVLLGLGALVVLGLALELVRALSWRRSETYVFDPDWFRPSERALLAVLEHLLGNEYRVLVRVGAREVLVPVPRLGRRARARAAARLGGYSFNFLLCERASLSVRAAIRLVPQGQHRKTRAPDELAQICAATGLPLLTLVERPHYALAEIDAELRRLLRDRNRLQARVIDEELSPDEWAALEDLARAIDERKLG